MATFQWRPEDQGTWLNGSALAKMWGQLMIVPSHYLANITRLASSGSFTDRVGNLATFAKNTGAFYGANRAAGMSGTNLLPWKVISLRGGPVWSFAAQLTQSKNIKQDLDIILKQAGSMFPAAQLKQLAQVGKNLAEGDPWKAFLTLVGRGTNRPMYPVANAVGKVANQVSSALNGIGNMFKR